MATTQYIGSRYVPIFADPIGWSSTKEYEPLTIVTHEGNSYTSKQFVPVGVDISNETFWALTGNYNAQIEQYRGEVVQLNSQVTELDENVDIIDGKVGFFTTPSVSTMRNLDVSVGDIVQTSYYTNEVVGGGAFYKITNDVPNAIDKIALENGLTASLCTDTTLDIREFGCIPNDAEIDNHARIQRACDLLEPYMSLYIPSGLWWVSDCVQIADKNKFTVYGDGLFDSYLIANARFDKTKEAVLIIGSTQSDELMRATFDFTVRDMSFNGIRGDTSGLCISANYSILIERVRGYAGNVYNPETDNRENAGLLLVRGATIRVSNCALFNSSGYGIMTKKSPNISGSTSVTGTLVISNTVFVENVTHIAIIGSVANLVIQNCTFGSPSPNVENYGMQFGMSITIIASVVNLKLSECTFKTAMNGVFYMGTNAIANYGTYDISDNLFDACDKTPIMISRIINTSLKLTGNVFHWCCPESASSDVQDIVFDPFTNTYNVPIALGAYNCRALLISNNVFAREPYNNVYAIVIDPLQANIGRHVFISENIFDSGIQLGSTTLDASTYVKNSVVEGA